MQSYIIGCGKVGQKVAQLLGKSDVTGVVRRPESARLLESKGIDAYLLDLDDDDTALRLNTAGANIYYFAPPPADGVVDSRMRRFVELLEESGVPRRIVYISTTGVYGDCAGEWVDETRQPAPMADRARRRLDAENRLGSWRQHSGGELVMLRVAGIYDPENLPIERLKKGLPVIRQQDSPYTNRIHLADLARICVAAMQQGHDGEVYNVSDGNPGTMADYFNRIADHVGLPRPPVIPLSEGGEKLSPGMMSYMQESRRLDNHKMLTDLEITLEYPSLDDALGHPATSSVSR